MNELPQPHVEIHRRQMDLRDASAAPEYFATVFVFNNRHRSSEIATQYVQSPRTENRHGQVQFVAIIAISATLKVPIPRPEQQPGVRSNRGRVARMAGMLRSVSSVSSVIRSRSSPAYPTPPPARFRTSKRTQLFRQRQPVFPIE